MLRKISLTFVLLLLFGCANLPKENDSITLQEQSLINKINEGKINEATEFLTEINLTLEPKKIKNYQTLISKREQEVKNLENLIIILKNAFSRNLFFIIERHTYMSVKNRIKLKELKKFDLSRGKFYIGKPIFSKDQASILTVVNFYDESFYLDIFFTLKNGTWKITYFNERG